tara:strand:- start:22 stop:204 length:183 start_codon:yes stop_codon:yes gene_type:complete
MSTDKAKRLEPAKCNSVGRLLTKNKIKIQTFSSWSIDEEGMEIGTVETIPMSWVIDIKYL